MQYVAKKPAKKQCEPYFYQEMGRNKLKFTIRRQSALKRIISLKNIKKLWFHEVKKIIKPAFLKMYSVYISVLRDPNFRAEW